MIAKFVIPGRLPSLNEIIAVAQYNRFAYGHLKKKSTGICAQAVIAHQVPKFDKPVTLDILYIEKNARRDIDGVFSAGMKFILDALGPESHGGTGRIPNDTREWVKEIRNSAPLVDPKNPRIEVWIREATSPVNP